MGILDTAKGNLAARKFKQSALGQALALHSQDYLFLNFVVDGVQHPFFRWIQQWPDRYLAGEGPLHAGAGDDDLDRYAQAAS